MSQQEKPSRTTVKIRSLHGMCQYVIVKHLERYPPEAMGILGPDEWEAVVKLRHLKTKPQHFTKKGIDGTGRMVPAISAKWMTELEEVNTHLRDSSVADELVWRDCVRHQFKSGGVLRPRALELPWPLLVKSIQDAKTNLENIKAQTTACKAPTVEDRVSTPDEGTTDIHVARLSRTLDVLATSPMNVALLQTTGIGKTVKRFIKACNQSLAGGEHIRTDTVHWSALNMNAGTAKEKLQPVLERWKTLPGITNKDKAVASNGDKAQQQELEDLQIAQSCSSWRDLYHALLRRRETVRTHQGARMREIRKNLSKDRPKIVKVRPSHNPKHTAMLQKKRSHQPRQQAVATGSATKMQQLRSESAVAASRLKPAAKLQTFHSKRGNSKAAIPTASFGAAVAFASGDLRKKKATKRKHPVIATGGGKQMTVPKKALRTGRGGVAVALKKSRK